MKSLTALKRKSYLQLNSQLRKDQCRMLARLSGLSSLITDPLDALDLQMNSMELDIDSIELTMDDEDLELQLVLEYELMHGDSLGDAHAGDLFA